MPPEQARGAMIEPLRGMDYDTGMDESSAPELVASLPRWSRILREQSVPPLLAPDFDRAATLTQLDNLRRRLRDGAAAPLRVAFFGPTGVGKSKIFNSLLEENVSPSGFRRPFTRRSLYYLHDYWRGMAAGLESEALLHQHDAWRDLILIDTPDFDSVEESNRDEARRIFAEADAFVFVTDALKYADASTWEYLKRIVEAEKPTIVILNKVNSPEVVESFVERSAATWGKSAEPLDAWHQVPIVIREFAIDDATRIDPLEPPLVELKRRLQTLLDDDPIAIRTRRLRKECEDLHRRMDGFSQVVSAREVELSELRGMLHRRRLDAEQRLESRLASGVTPALREEVYQRIMQRMNEIDWLRYPRQILSLPARGIKHVVGRWWRGGSADSDGASAKDQWEDMTTAETFHVLESELLRFSDEVRLDILGVPGMTRLLSREKFQALRLRHDAIREAYAAHHREFGDWVRNHARDTATEITSGNKATFYLSQVLYNSLVITAQVHSGGLSIFELGLDSVISPFMAKAIGAGIGEVKVRQFELDAKNEHRRSLSKIFDAALGHFNGFLEEVTLGMDSLATVARQVRSQTADLDPVLEYFHRQVGTESRP